MLQIIQGDCLSVLPTLPEKSVQCCITSPPYWGLRDYGTAQWEGGDEGCEHISDQNATKTFGNAEFNENRPSRAATKTSGYYYKDICHCGARRIDSQLGLESTPEEYIANMVAVFREVWRVLRDDGTLWLNLGDSYASSPASGGVQSALLTGGEHKRTPQLNGYRRPPGLKPKDLCGIPWRLALALQADGWYLRSDIIWHKPNPMPESVTDRPTKAHEYIFLLTKAERYFYDAEAIREPANRPEGPGNITPMYIPGERNGLNANIRGSLHKIGPSDVRNKRTVWTIATQPCAEAHFATFPEEIPKLAILAGSKPGDAILDPFAGSGTVGKVALELGRRAVLIELNPEYIKLAEQRCNVTPGFPL